MRMVGLSAICFLVLIHERFHCSCQLIWSYTCLSLGLKCIGPALLDSNLVYDSIYSCTNLTARTKFGGKDNVIFVHHTTVLVPEETVFAFNGQTEVKLAILGGIVHKAVGRKLLPLRFQTKYKVF